MLINLLIANIGIKTPIINKTAINELRLMLFSTSNAVE